MTWQGWQECQESGSMKFVGCPPCRPGYDYSWDGIGEWRASIRAQGRGQHV